MWSEEIVKLEQLYSIFQTWDARFVEDKLNGKTECNF